MNPYLKDAIYFFKNVSAGIKGNLNDNEVIQLSLNFSLGMERLLKSILYDVNPLYVLVEPKFEHSFVVIYSEKISTDIKGTKELVENPNEDVITFKKSLLRSQLISKTVFDNKNLLFNLSNSRDIIAHNQLSKLDLKELKLMLQRDYYPLISSLSDELNINKSLLLYGRGIELAKLSGKLQDDIDKKMKLEFESYRMGFDINRKVHGFIDAQTNKTESVFQTGNKYKIECPCCGNTALIYTEPIFRINEVDNEISNTDFEIKKLKCFYCKLEADSYKKLDYLQKIILPGQNEMEGFKYIGTPFVNPKCRYYILNTNIQNGEDDDNDMLREGKASAYFDPWKYKIEKFEKGDTIFLYRSGEGIVAFGTATGETKTNNYQGNPEFKDEEYYQKLKKFKILSIPITAAEIKVISEVNYVFMPVMFSIDEETGKALVKLAFEERIKI